MSHAYCIQWRFLSRCYMRISTPVHKDGGSEPWRKILCDLLTSLQCTAEERERGSMPVSLRRQHDDSISSLTQVTTKGSAASADSPGTFGSGATRGGAGTRAGSRR